MSILILMSKDPRDLAFKELTQVDVVGLSTMWKTMCASCRGLPLPNIGADFYYFWNVLKKNINVE